MSSGGSERDVSQPTAAGGQNNDKQTAKRIYANILIGMSKAPRAAAGNQAATGRRGG